ncbi:MAG: cytochrome b/b6 domain-containing protein [Halobacterium sp.]
MSRIQELRDSVRERTAAVDEEYREALAAEERATRERHGLGTRVSHWLLVGLFFALLATGVLMWQGWYGPLATDVYGGYYPAFGVHMWAGILVLAVGFVLFPFYHVVVDGHDPTPTAADVRDTATIVAAFVGLRSYVAGYHRARRAWDAEDGEWVAYHPAQKLFWWTQLALFALLAFTGFAMYDRMAADPPAWVGWLGAPAAWLAPETQLQVHVFLALALTGAVLLHVYFAVLPGNWDVLGSMVTGDVDAYVVRGDDDSTEEAGDADAGDAAPAAADGGGGGD